MTDGGLNLLYKDMTDGRSIGSVHQLLDITDKFFEYSLEYAQIFHNKWTRALLDVTDERTNGRVDPSVAVTTLPVVSSFVLVISIFSEALLPSCFGILVSMMLR